MKNQLRRDFTATPRPLWAQEEIQTVGHMYPSHSFVGSNRGLGLLLGSISENLQFSPWCGSDKVHLCSDACNSHSHK